MYTQGLTKKWIPYVTNSSQFSQQFLKFPHHTNNLLLTWSVKKGVNLSGRGSIFCYTLYTFFHSGGRGITICEVLHYKIWIFEKEVTVVYSGPMGLNYIRFLQCKRNAKEFATQSVNKKTIFTDKNFKLSLHFLYLTSFVFWNTNRTKNSPD